MRTLIDTSSLVALARYYDPFDDTDAMNRHIQSELQKGNLILLDRVQEESRNVSQGLAHTAFPCLAEKGMARSTHALVPTRKFFNMLDNNFVDRMVKRRRLADDEAAYQNEREAYLKGADCALLVYAMNNSSDLDPIRIMTEESASTNDGKLFKKIPLCCMEIGIETITSVDYLKTLDSLEVKVLAK